MLSLIIDLYRYLLIPPTKRKIPSCTSVAVQQLGRYSALPPACAVELRIERI